MTMPDAQRIYDRCQALARHSEQPDGLTRVFLSTEQRAVSALVQDWIAGRSLRYMSKIGTLRAKLPDDMFAAICPLPWLSAGFV